MNSNPLKYRDPTGHFCANVGTGNNTICSVDDDNGWNVSKPVFLNPTTKMWLSGYDYGDKNGTVGGHNGIDIGDPPNEIRASTFGIVHISDPCSASPCVGIDPTTNGGYGNVLVIEYPFWALPKQIQDQIKEGQSIFVLYAHLESAPNVQEGSAVFPGQTIGTIGSTGNSDGSHLHLETRIGDPKDLEIGPMTTNSYFTDGDPNKEQPLWEQWWNLTVSDPNAYYKFNAFTRIGH